jgi:hypothetical protein
MCPLVHLAHVSRNSSLPSFLLTSFASSLSLPAQLISHHRSGKRIAIMGLVTLEYGLAIAGVGVVGGILVSTLSLLALLRKIFDDVGFAPPIDAQLEASQATWQTHALFRHFPDLRSKIAWRAFGTFPTPVHRCTMTSSRDQSVITFAVKREDLASPEYGGNKVRTLQHSLAVCEARQPSRVVVMGSGGSNQIVATLVHGRKAQLPIRPLWVKPDLPDLDNTLNMLSGLSLSQGKGLHSTWGTPFRCVYSFMTGLW